MVRYPRALPSASARFLGQNGACSETGGRERQLATDLVPYSLGLKGIDRSISENASPARAAELSNIDLWRIPLSYRKSGIPEDVQVGTVNDLAVLFTTPSPRGNGLNQEQVFHAASPLNNQKLALCRYIGLL